MVRRAVRLPGFGRPRCPKLSPPSPSPASREFAVAGVCDPYQIVEQVSPGLTLIPAGLSEASYNSQNTTARGNHLASAGRVIQSAIKPSLTRLNAYFFSSARLAACSASFCSSLVDGAASVFSPFSTPAATAFALHFATAVRATAIALLFAAARAFALFFATAALLFAAAAVATAVAAVGAMATAATVAAREHAAEATAAAVASAPASRLPWLPWLPPQLPPAARAAEAAEEEPERCRGWPTRPRSKQSERNSFPRSPFAYACPAVTSPGGDPNHALRLEKDRSSQTAWQAKIFWANPPIPFNDGYRVGRLRESSNWRAVPGGRMALQTTRSVLKYACIPMRRRRQPENISDQLQNAHNSSQF